MISPLEILFAFLLDAAIGDPRWLPHPVRIIGKAISGAERVLRRFFTTASLERVGGIFLVLSVTLPVYGITDRIVLAAAEFSGRLFAVVGTAIVIFLAATTIATRELIRSAQVVITAVKAGDLAAARRNLSMIVGRDTRELSDKGVLKATIETLAENLSDGVIAPLFYLAVGGLPLAMTYKAVNTLDSMVGYKNEKYLRFGWAGARLDDLANYLPARITGLMIVLSAFLVAKIKRLPVFGPQRVMIIPPHLDPLPDGERMGGISAGRAFNSMLRDGGKHPSPNSGMPEAAMAGALGIRLGGPSTYGGVLSDKPFIGEEEREDYLSASSDAITLVKVSSAVAAALAMAMAAVRSLA